MQVAGGQNSQSPAFTANGDTAGTNYCATSGDTIYCISVFVARGGSRGAESTYLSYDYFASNPTINQFVDYYGFGEIPNSAFQVQGNRYSVDIDTSTVPGFQNYYCNTSVCGEIGTGGPVSGTWSPITPQIGTKSTGTVTMTTPGAKYIQNGTQESNAALSSVTVLGYIATNVSGNVGTQRNTTINIQHK